jgi:hypothetical protein
MPATIHQKLASIVQEIDRRGCAELTRLTVLKQWFAVPGRLVAFSLWVAAQAAADEASRSEPAAELLREARALLAKVHQHGDLQPTAMRDLYGRLKAFQDEHRRLKWGSVRVIRATALLVIEEAFAICLWHRHEPAVGYKLAASYCEHYDPRFGNNLNGPSQQRVQGIADFVARREADEVIFAQRPRASG